MRINAQGGELVLRNEHGDTIIVPRERRKEAMSALLKDDHRAIDSLALQLPKAERYAAGGTVLDGQDPGNGLTRSDGTKKGKGFYGNLPNKNGNISSELSISSSDVEEGKEVLIPTLIPGLSRKEIDYLLSNKYNPQSRVGIDNIISRKAIDFARKRKQQGFPYFAHEIEEGAFKYASGGNIKPDPSVEGIMGPETTITAPRPEKSIGNFFKRWGYENSKGGSESLLGAIGSGIGAALQLPQAAVTYMLDPKGNVKPGKALTENGFNSTSIMKNIGKYAATHNDLSGTLAKLVGTEEGQNVLLDPLLASGKVSKIASRGAELVNGLGRTTNTVGMIAENIKYPKISTEMLQNAKGWPDRLQFLKELKAKELVGKEFKANEILSVARSNKRTDELTKLALDNYHTKYRSVSGTLPKNGIGRGDYAGPRFDMNKPAYGQTISEFDNMKKAGVDFSNPESIARYQASHIPLEDYGYRATGEHPTPHYGYLFASPKPEISREYGIYQFKSKPNLDFTTGHYREWLQKHYDDLKFHTDDLKSLPYMSEEITKQRAAASKVMMQHRNSPAVLIGPRGTKAFEIDETFPILKSDERLEQLAKQHKNDYVTGWRDKLNDLQGAAENKSLLDEYNTIDYRKNPLSDKEKEMYQWFDEQMRFDKLPQTTNKQSIEVLDNFKQRIRTPEGQKRLKELGITEEQLLQDLKIVEDPNTYGYYRSAKNTIAMNPAHPLPKKVVRHEIEHGVQNALKQSKINKVIDGTPDEKLKALESSTTEIDDILSGLTLRREGTPGKVWGKNNTNETVNINNYKALINNKQNATDYFLTGSDGAEKSAFLGEVQQYMMDIGKIPKNSYVEITPEMVKETMIDAMFDEKGGGKYLRLFNIIKADPKNYEIISKGLNKMLTVSPFIGAGAYMQNKEYKNGGAIGNNGMFDMTNPNIFKGLAPTIIAGALALQLPKASRYAAGGTVLNGEDPGDPTLLKPQPYKPSNRVLDAKATLAGLSLAGNAFAPTIGYGAQLLNVGGDLYTGTRYAMDGQYKNAAIDYGEALVGLIPSSRIIGGKGPFYKIRVVDNTYANNFNIALDLLDLSNAPNNYDMKKQNKTKTKK